MIPKIIHYCWFGGKELPESAKKCIASWKKYCPDYKIIQWDESNFDMKTNLFIEQAYANRKYAFVSDFARFQVLRDTGGIYLDTDVELIKPLDDLLSNKAFMGFEKIKDKVTGVAPGLIIGTEPQQQFIIDMIDLYNHLEFCDANNERTAKSVVEYMTNYLIDKGCELTDKKQLVQDIVIYPSEYFCPKDYESGEINLSEATYSIHHYDSSWWNPKALYLRSLTEKYGYQKGLFLYRITRLFNLKLWWRIIHEK